MKIGDRVAFKVASGRRRVGTIEWAYCVDDTKVEDHFGASCDKLGALHIQTKKGPGTPLGFVERGQNQVELLSGRA